jgi:hypothetical protein
MTQEAVCEIYSCSDGEAHVFQTHDDGTRLERPVCGADVSIKHQVADADLCCETCENWLINWSNDFQSN